MADNLLATQLRKGMIIKVDNKLYRMKLNIAGAAQ